MKKITLAVLLATSLIAAEKADYFGVSIGSTKLKTSLSTVSTSDDGGSITANLGHYYEDTSRISASYTYIRHENNIDKSDSLSLAYDFILPLAKDKFSIYAGPVLGYTRYEETLLDLSGFHYGAQAGAIVRVADSFEIEGGYRYVRENGSDAGFELDDMQNWYVGANIRF